MGKLHQWREAQILKDRSGTIDGQTFKNPVYKNFKPLIDYLLNVPVGDVAGESNSTNLARKKMDNSLNGKRKKILK